MPDESHAQEEQGRDEATERRLAHERERIRRTALARIRQYPDVALRMRAREVTAFDSFLVQLVERMLHLMDDAQGVGLAATQVGVLQRVFVFRPAEDAPAVAVVNPRLTELAAETATEEEGCLSLGEVRVPVERPVRVTLDGRDPNGDGVHLELEGLAARVVQHEHDHLDGILIIDRTDPESRRRALGALRPRPALAAVP